MYRRENVLLNWVLIGLLIISGAAFAQGIMGDAKEATPDYAKLDINADGFLTLAETRQVSGLPEMFERVDINGDSKLDLAEYVTYQALTKDKVFSGG